MVSQFLVGPFWWSKRSIAGMFLSGIVSGVAMASGALILASGGVLVGSVPLGAPGAVVVAVVTHDSYVRSLRTYISSGWSFRKIKFMYKL